MHIESLKLGDVMIFLVAAGLVIPLVRRLRFSPVLGFLAVGLVIGPFGFGRFAETMQWLNYVVITDLAGVQALAELGVVFLLFMIGLELSVERLWAMRRLVFGLGGAQVLTCGAVIAALASWFENPMSAAVVIGAGLSLSSTAIIMQLLEENKRLGTRAGRASFAILLFQDLAVLPILFLVGAIATQADSAVRPAFAIAIGKALIAVTVIYALGRVFIRPLFRFVGRTASREMFLALVLLIIIGTALLTQQAGLSMALGAFLAGLLFSETEYRHAIEVDIEPFKGLLLGLFFISVGMSIDLAQFAQRPVLLLASVAGLYAIKSPIIYGLARLFRQSHAISVEVGLLLGQAGEFAFVVFGLAYGLGILPSDTVQFMLLVTGLTMLVTPMIANLARWLSHREEVRKARRGLVDAESTDGLTGHVIIVGYGRIGQLLGAVLASQDIPYIGLDIDPALVNRFRRRGAGVYYGDASQAAILRSFRIDRAVALVVTMDSARAAEQVVTAARQHWPELRIYARARDTDHARRLRESGANEVIPETLEASMELCQSILQGVGLPADSANQLVNVQRQLAYDAIEKNGTTKSR